MSNITLEIGGRTYMVACGPGEEGHVAALGRLIDEKTKSLPAQSEARTLLFAALLLAHEISELRAKNDSPPPAGDDASEIAEPLEMIAERLEKLATRLENGASDT